MRMVILQMAQAPPIHHVSQTVTTLNRLLKFLKTGPMFVSCVLLWWVCVCVWVGGWLPPPESLGFPKFW